VHLTHLTVGQKATVLQLLAVPKPDDAVREGAVTSAPTSATARRAVV
jgi:hypothetical protein